MRHIVKFQIKNRIQITQSWAIDNNERKYFFDRNGEFVSAVAVMYENISIEEAPQIKAGSIGHARTTISLSGHRVSEAIRSLRAWQALLATYCVVDIDFDAVQQEFEPENDLEKSQIKISSFSLGRTDSLTKFKHEFAVFGRAFLAIDRGFDLIEPMAFYMEGRKAQSANRTVDAYNNYYLFLESRYKLKHNNRAAAQQLINLHEVDAAVREIISDPYAEKMVRSTRFEPGSWVANKYDVALSIVELRGQLRHHSIGNPNRWNPVEQEKFKPEANFLAALCQIIASAISFDISWEPSYVASFVAQTQKLGLMMEVAAFVTIEEGGVLNEVSFNVKLPRVEPSPQLAKTVLERCLTEFDQRFPAAQILGIRAKVGSNGPELFRYDLGPGIQR